MYGKAVSPSGETHLSDSIIVGSSVVPFQLIAGNNDWGNWTLLFGSGDLNKRFNLNVLEAIDLQGTPPTTFFIQLAFSKISAADALTKGTYTSVVVAKGDTPVPVSVLTALQESGTKVWGRCLAVGQNALYAKFYAGVIFYEV